MGSAAETPSQIPTEAGLILLQDGRHPEKDAVDEGGNRRLVQEDQRVRDGRKGGQRDQRQVRCRDQRHGQKGGQARVLDGGDLGEAANLLRQDGGGREGVQGQGGGCQRPGQTRAPS